MCFTVSVWPLTALDKGSSLTPAQRIFIDTQTEPPQPRQPVLNSPVSTSVANTLMCLAFSRQTLQSKSIREDWNCDRPEHADSREAASRTRWYITEPKACRRRTGSRKRQVLVPAAVISWAVWSQLNSPHAFLLSSLQAAFRVAGKSQLFCCFLLSVHWNLNTHQCCHHTTTSDFDATHWKVIQVSVSLEFTNVLEQM